LFSTLEKEPARSALHYMFPCLLAIGAVVPAAHVDAATLHVGAASCDITPDMPSFLAGQFSPRVSQGVEYPLTANVLALESRDGDKPLDSAIIISVDTAIEGMEDHDVNTMFFWDIWDTSDKLLAIVVNVSCPSQEVESNRLLSSDYWGPTREMLKE